MELSKEFTKGMYRLSVHCVWFLGEFRYVMPVAHSDGCWLNQDPVERSAHVCGAISSSLWSNQLKFVERSAQACGASSSSLWSDQLKFVERSFQVCGAIGSCLWSDQLMFVERSAHVFGTSLTRPSDLDGQESCQWWPDHDTSNEMRRK